MCQTGNRKATVPKGLAVATEVTLGTGFKPFCFSVHENYKASKYITSLHVALACATWLDGSTPDS